MSSKYVLKINTRILPLMFMLTVACLKWLFEGILDFALLEAVLLCLGLVFLMLKSGQSIKLKNAVWMLYALNILFSLASHDSSFSMWGQGLISFMITLCAVFYDNEIVKYRDLMRYIIKIGILCAVLVMVHFVLKDRFNSIYFCLLDSKAADLASLYYQSGYYFGFMYNPHEPAGLISYAIAGIVLWKVISGRRGMGTYLMAAVLLVPLLLTGKKGLMVCLVITLTIIILILYSIQKQWSRVFGLLLALVVLGCAFVYLSLSHPEIAIFSRFNEFFIQLFSGSNLDSTRTALYRVAFEEFQAHPLTGIGWNQFNALTTEKYGFSRGHAVNCDYLQLLCETGIIGFVLGMTPILTTLKRSIYICRKMIRKMNDINAKWVVLLAVFIQFFTLIYAFFEIPFYDIVFFTVYIISCIVINSTYSRRGMYV